MHLATGASRLFRVPFAAFSFATCLSANSALAFGLPIYVSAPTDATFTNVFGPDLRPTGTVSIGGSGVFASQVGGGDLVGDSFSFSTIADLSGFTAAPGAPSIAFDGVGAIVLSGRPFVEQSPGALFMTFPVFFDVAHSFIEDELVENFTFEAPFEGYSGPDNDHVIELLVTIAYAGDLPTKTFLDPATGEAIFYVEGTLSNATFEFSRLDGAPNLMVSSVPLPATLPLALGALGLLAAVARRRRSN